MTMRARVSIVVLLFACTVSTFAKQAVIVLPVAVSTPIPGANGSLWITDFVIRNMGPSPIQFGYPEGCGAPVCSPWAEVAPYATRRLSIDAPSGAMLLMSSSDPVNLVCNLRVRDLSRQSETWGTEIPVLRLIDLSTIPIHLLNVPVSADFRTTIRIYDLADLNPRTYRIRAFSLTTDALLSERVVTTAHVPGQGMTQVTVAYAPPENGGEAVRVEVAPMSEGSRFWAFAAATNNATQHVTVITQQPY